MMMNTMTHLNLVALEARNAVKHLKITVMIHSSMKAPKKWVEIIPMYPVETD